MGNMSCSGQGFQYPPKYFGTLVDQFYLVIDRDVHVHQRALTYDYQSSTEFIMDVGIAINTNIADASL